MNNTSLEQDKAERILASRAELVAQEKIVSKTTSAAAILVFNVGEKQQYAIVYSAIDKVIPEQKITPIPGINPLFSGLLYHNAEIWPVINLQVLLNCKQEESASNFILLHEEQCRCALSVGNIIGQIQYEEATVLEGLSEGEMAQRPYVSGIYQTDIALIDTSAIFKLLKTIPIGENIEG